MENAILRYKHGAKSNSWARYGNGRMMRKNQNNMWSFIGPTGSGKTYSGLAVGEMISKLNGVPFTIDNIVFSLRELMILIKSNKIKKGSVILFDEPQASIGSRDFQSIANKVFNLLISTFRHRNLTLLFCTPFESLLDRSTRRMFHARFHTQNINRVNKTCRLNPFFLQWGEKADPYTKRLIVSFKTPQGKRIARKISYWDVPLPSDNLIVLYEAKKKAFTDNLNDNIMLQLDKFDESGKSMTSEIQPVERKPLTDIQLETMKALASVKTPNKLKGAAEILGKATATIHENKKYAESKGWTVEEFINHE